MDDTAVWIIVALAVLALIALAVYLARRQSTSRKEQKADSIREEAQQKETELRRREAEAAEIDAQARMAQAEADAKAAEAKRLAATAQDRESSAGSFREEMDTQYRSADEIDPRTRDRTE